MSTRARVERSIRARYGVALCVAGMVLSTPELQAQTLQSAPTAMAAHVGRGEQQTDGDAWHLDRCLLGVSYGAPLKLNAGIGAGLRRAGASRTVCLFGAAQLGFGGTRTSLGAATTLGRYGSGLGVSGGLLRTFANPLGAAPWSNYAGGSVHVWPIIGLHTEVGWYRAIGTNATGRDNVVAWSVGLGL